MTTLLNIGSIINISIILNENVKFSLPNSNNEIAISQSLSWDAITFTQNSASFSETEKPTSEGIVYDQKLVWTIPKVSPTNFAIAHKWTNKQVIIKFTDANNNVYILGSETAPAYIKVNSQIPGKPDELNCYKLSVIYQSPHSVYFVA
jgi:hypothetical protein